MKPRLLFAATSLFLLTNLSPLFAAFTVERDGNTATIKENGRVLISIENPESAGSAVETIWSMIEGDINLVESINEHLAEYARQEEEYARMLRDPQFSGMRRELRNLDRTLKEDRRRAEGHIRDAERRIRNSVGELLRRVNR